MILDFAHFTLDTGRAELRNGDAVVALEPKVYALLRLLVENHDRVVIRDEMIAVVWGGRFISDAAVSTALKQVRRALGDDGASQVFIRTLHGMGHRFVAPVRIKAAAAAARQPDTTVTDDWPGGQPTIAVLPFGATGLPENFASLSDALPAEIISALSRLRWLRVIARESSFRYRGADVDIQGVRAVLGAGYCLTGRVEMPGGRMAVTVDLVDTAHGRLVWSDRLEGSPDDVHGMRHSIVQAVIAALDLQIPLAEAARARTRAVEALDAWSAYHLGLSHMYRFNARDNAIAAGLLQRATELDPGFASAFAARSFTSFQNAMMGYTGNRATEVDAARAFAERSVELDPLDPHANVAMGRVPILSGHPEDGLLWLERSVALSPSHAKGHYSMSFVQAMSSRPGEARDAVDLAMGLSPLDPLVASMLMMRGISFGIDGDFETAAKWNVRASRMAPTHFGGLVLTVAMCTLSGQDEAATHWIQMLRERRPDATWTQFLVGLPFQDSVFRQKLVSALIAAGLPE
ncbi:MAG: winged helix-turn-helix domain-containing protein [Pseudomonadota bacterium]